MSKTVAVIDGNSLMHRAYHAVPPTMNAPDGTPTNACFGFVAMLLKFVEMAHPDAIVCAFDAGRPKWRMEAIEQYKAQRPPMDDALKVQFPLMEGLLEAMNIPVVRVKGWEGDDILGTVSARDEALGYRTLLVSGDKDVYQLVSELTHVVTTKKGITDVAIYGPDEVFERYGVTPAQFPDFLGLKGDASDNIPGVPGVGDKTAAKLLSAYGNLEGIYEHTGELKGKQKEKIETNRDQAFASRKVATISRDVDFELDLEDAAFPSFDAARVTAAFKNVRFNAHLTHVLNLVGEKAPTERAALSWEPVLHGADAHAAVKGAIAEGERVGIAFVEPEQASLFDTGAFAAFSTSKGVASFEGDEALSVLARVVAQGRFAALDAKEMLHRVYPADTAQEARITDEELFAAEIFDVGLAGYVMNSSVSDYTLESLADEYLGGALPEVKTDEERACVLAAAARALSRRSRFPARSKTTGRCARTPRLTCRLSLCSPRWSARAPRSTSRTSTRSASARRATSMPYARGLSSLPARSSTSTRPNSSVISCSRFWACRRRRKRSADIPPTRRCSRSSPRFTSCLRSSCATASSPRSSRPTSTRCPACAQPTGVSIPRSTRR